ncbi:Mis12 protein-domain-containing protein [Amylocystis lapponica]|nr:Mis12 protein-domain-containing protein [Amylocystis lapponica]
MSIPAPAVLLPELLGFVPQLLLDDIINIANDATRQAVDAMEKFLERREAVRTQSAEADWANMEELEKGLNSFQTLLEFHVDIAFDFLEAWSLRNIFAIPADLPLVAPHHRGLNLNQPPEHEQELLDEIKDLRRQIQAQRKLRRLYAHAVRKSAAQLAHAQQRLTRLAFLRAPPLQELGALPAAFLAMYASVSALPPPGPAPELPTPEPGKRPWETSRSGYLSWAVEQLMQRAKEGAPGGEGSLAAGAAAAAAYGVASVADVRAVLERTAGEEAVKRLGTREE